MDYNMIAMVIGALLAVLVGVFGFSLAGVKAALATAKYKAGQITKLLDDATAALNDDSIAADELKLLVADIMDILELAPAVTKKLRMKVVRRK